MNRTRLPTFSGAILCLDGHANPPDMWHTTGRGRAIRSVKVIRSIRSSRTSISAYVIVDWRCKKVSSYRRGERAPCYQPIRRYARTYCGYSKPWKSIVLSKCRPLPRRHGSGQENSNKSHRGIGSSFSQRNSWRRCRSLTRHRGWCGSFCGDHTRRSKRQCSGLGRITPG